MIIKKIKNKTNEKKEAAKCNCPFSNLDQAENAYKDKKISLICSSSWAEYNFGITISRIITLVQSFKMKRKANCYFL